MEVYEVGKKHTMFNVTLAKIYGLYQILDPESIKVKNHNVYRVVNMVFVLFLFVVSAINVVKFVNIHLNVQGHGTDAMVAIGVASLVAFTGYKMLIIINRADGILDCMSITRFDFTSLGCEHARLLEFWRNRCTTSTDLYAYSCYVVTALYISSPLLFGDKLITVTAVDGSVRYYRNNVLNLYVVPAETYNEYFFVMYVIEAMTMILTVHFYVIFDTLLAELCLSLVCQLKVINAALESLGHEPIADRQNPNNTDDDIELKTTDEQCIVHNDLVTIIDNHQAVIEKYEKLLSLFGEIVLTQIFVSSNSLIVIWFTVIKEFTDGNIQTDAGALTNLIQMIVAFPVISFQLFLACYLFELISDEKELIIFSLYSSNWTEMDTKCRNLILLTMKMNNAHPRKLKFSQFRVVNLQMFLGTMRVCYTIISMMLNQSA